MSRWQDFFDHEFGAPFVYREYEDVVLIHENSGILRPKVEDAILKFRECATAFLLGLVLGKINISNQQRVALILYRLFEQAKKDKRQDGERLHELRSALQAFQKSLPWVLKAHAFDLSLDEEHLVQAAGFGDGLGAIHYGLGHARRVASIAYLTAVIERLLSWDHKTEKFRFGQWFLHVQNPVDQGFTAKCAGTHYEAVHAEGLTLPNRKEWLIRFLDFPWLYNEFDLQGAAYRAAAPIMAYVLQADVTAYGDITDEY